MSEATRLKEEGNSAFKAGKLDEALACYTKAIKLAPSSGSETGVYYKNRAAVYLKKGSHQAAVDDSSKALEFSPNDPKALFRRCQAHEALEKYEEAYKDAMTLVRVDPKNSAAQQILHRLNPIVQERVKKFSSTDHKVQQMFDLAFGSDNKDEEKRQQAMNNLVVLAREEAGSNMILAGGGVGKLLHLLESSRDAEIQVNALRVLACLANNNRKRAEQVYKEVTLKKMATYMAVENEHVSTAAAHLLQNALTSITDIDSIKKARDKYEERRKATVGCKDRPWAWAADKVEEDVMPMVDEVFFALITMLKLGRVSAHGRDNAMELIIKFVTRRNGLGWERKFIQNEGIQALLEVAGTVAEHATLKTTTNSRMHASLAMSKVYEELPTDGDRDSYRAAVDAYFVDMLGDNIMESKLEAIMALTALLQGPFEVGNAVLGRPGILEMMLAMVDSGNAIHVKYAVEALVQAISKKDRASGLIKQATPVLKQLYQSQNDQVKVRALVGLCKLGSFGGTDASMKSFADGSTQTLAKACRKFMVNPAKDVDLRKWAAEGLAFLSLDAEVKDDLCEDMDALRSLMDLAKVKDKGVLYPCAQILVNVTNSYDKPKVEPELIELAKFAQHHVPEEHEKDKGDSVETRVEKVVQAGVVNALVALSKTDSENCRELLSRVFLAVCKEVSHRGLVVQQGGAKALIPLAREGTAFGKERAAQALAKIAITNDPNIAFPGQRAAETIKPIMSLLAMEASALQTYEALLALTNLASMNSSIRKRMVKEDIMSSVENYMYDEHEDLRRGAVECMCNLVMEEEVAKMFEGENDRVKMLILLCHEDEEDERVARGAAGALAMLSYEKVICGKITTATKQWFDILSKLMTHSAPDLQHRAVHIVMNMVSADKEIATRIVESPMMEILMAITLLQEPQYQGAKACALKALEAAVEWGLIKANPHKPEAGSKSKKQAQDKKKETKNEEPKEAETVEEKAPESKQETPEAPEPKEETAEAPEPKEENAEAPKTESESSGASEPKTESVQAPDSKQETSEALEPKQETSQVGESVEESKKEENKVEEAPKEEKQEETISEQKPSDGK